MFQRSGFWNPLWLKLSVAMVLLAGASWAVRQTPPLPWEVEDEPELSEPQPPPSEYEYVWTRLAHYSPGFALSRNGHAWNTDYPKADRQFLQGVLRWTQIEARKQEQVLRPLDAELFAFPFLYAVEVGYLRFSEEEAARMREYLLRGGFLVVDDFHGTREWESF